MIRSVFAGVSFATVLFFTLAVSARMGDPAGVERRFLAQVGGVGLSMGVLPNSDNTAAEQLLMEEERLRARERELELRTVELKADPELRLFLYIGVGELLLFTLITANFYYDHRRRVDLNTLRQSVSPGASAP